MSILHEGKNYDSVRAAWLEYALHINKGYHPKPVVDAFAWLDTTDYWIAPASTRYHSVFEGGLAYHSLKMAAHLQRLTELHNIVWDWPYSPLLISLLHDACKTGVYKKEIRSRKITDDKGIPILNASGKPTWEDYIAYAFDDSECPMGHGSKSVILAKRHVQLTPQEELCILWHMGDYNLAGYPHSLSDGFMKATQKDVAVLWTHVADRLAGLDEVKEEKGPTPALFTSFTVES